MLPRIANFRDAGGLPSGSLAPGRVYRSAELSQVTSADRTALAGLGVSWIVDLRTADEIAHQPDALDASLQLTCLDVLADRPHSGAAAVASLMTAKRDSTTIQDVNDAVGGGRAHDLMIETYRYLVSLPSAHEAYRQLLAGVGASQGATVVHCTAGKDRTGWAIAVMQLLCGARLEDVVADYLLSNTAMEKAYGPMLESFADAGGDAESLADMIFVRPEYLEASLTLMAQVHGDLEGYLRSGIGLDDSTIDALSRRLTSGG